VNDINDFDTVLLLAEDIIKRFPSGNIQLAVRKGSDRLIINNGSLASWQNKDPKLRRDIGCIQNIFDGLVIFQLCQTGVLNSDAPLSEYFKEFKSAANEIKISHLMSHSTGFHAPRSFLNGHWFGSWDDVVHFFTTTMPSFPPGTVSSWNSLSRYLIHAVVERVTEQKVYEAVNEFVFHPNNINAEYINIESGWPITLCSIQDLCTVPNIALDAVNSRISLIDSLEKNEFRVAKGTLAPRASTPVGYSWGIARFSDNTWGLNSNMVPNTAALRFSKADNFAIAMALDGSHLARDLIMQYLTTSMKAVISSSNAGLCGSLFDCQMSEIEGIYTADTLDVLQVEVFCESVIINISRNGDEIAKITLSYKNGNLYNSGRWDTLQIEFFKHPSEKSICLLLGQITYIKIECQ